MADLEELTRFRNALEDARFSGVRRVRDASGEEIEYKSDSEISRALTSLESKIKRLQETQPTSIQFLTSKGL